MILALAASCCFTTEASQPICQLDHALGEFAIKGESLLQKEAHRAAIRPSGHWPLYEDSQTRHGIEQSCELKSPWSSNLSLQHDVSFEDYDDSPKSVPWGQGLFVYPPNNFAVCLIEKVACSTWIGSVLQPLLNNESACHDDCHGEIDYMAAVHSQKKFGQEGIESIFHDPNAIRAVFLRDPIERFVSAFLNKCPENQFDHWNCIVPEGTNKFRTAVEKALAENMSNVNPHWSPQADHCKLRTNLAAYNVIGLMKKQTFEDDMNCVLAKAGLERFIKSNPPNINPTMEAVNKVTPEIVLQKLFPQDVARKLINHIVDYDIFSFPKEPEWLKGATGEWYDLDPSQMPWQNDSEAYAIPVPVDGSNTAKGVEIDDIVELAIRAGYIA